MNDNNKGQKGDVLLEMRGVIIDGYSDDRWHEIIKGIDLVLRRGEVMGLIGESGAGKSTLGLAAMGFAKPGCKINGGSIIFDGIDLMKASETEKRKLRGSRITYVAQSAAASFNPSHRLIDQTVESAVRHGIKSVKEARVDARKLYRDLQLPNPDNIGERYPHQVSGGQLQRVMTAMAMSPRPDLIIFDEPTTAEPKITLGPDENGPPFSDLPAVIGPLAVAAGPSFGSPDAIPINFPSPPIGDPGSSATPVPGPQFTGRVPTFLEIPSPAPPTFLRVAMTPEPSSALMLGGGLLGIAAVRRRRARRS